MKGAFVVAGPAKALRFQTAVRWLSLIASRVAATLIKWAEADDRLPQASPKQAAKTISLMSDFGDADRFGEPIGLICAGKGTIDDPKRRNRGTVPSVHIVDDCSRVILHVA